MRQVITFTKDIVFKTKIATITSISLEHTEKINDGEIEGEFIIIGDYKIHSDTTEKEIFKYKLPFTALLPDNIITDSLQLDIANFTYEVHDEDVMKINIDYIITCEEQPERNIEDEHIEEQIDEILDLPPTENLNLNIPDEVNPINQPVNEEAPSPRLNSEKVQEETITEADDYITYHIHIVNEGETIESIIQKYETSMDTLKHYNNINSCKIGDKIIIPEKDE